jgi:hypothetical protein
VACHVDPGDWTNPPSVTLFDDGEAYCPHCNHVEDGAFDPSDPIGTCEECSDGQDAISVTKKGEPEYDPDDDPREAWITHDRLEDIH